MDNKTVNDVVELLADAKRQAQRAEARLIEAWCKEPDKRRFEHEAQRIGRAIELIQQSIYGVVRKA